MYKPTRGRVLRKPARAVYMKAVRAECGRQDPSASLTVSHSAMWAAQVAAQVVRSPSLLHRRPRSQMNPLLLSDRALTPEPRLGGVAGTGTGVVAAAAPFLALRPRGDSDEAELGLRSRVGEAILNRRNGRICNKHV